MLLLGNNTFWNFYETTSIWSSINKFDLWTEAADLQFEYPSNLNSWMDSNPPNTVSILFQLSKLNHYFYTSSDNDFVPYFWLQPQKELQNTVDVVDIPINSSEILSFEVILVMFLYASNLKRLTAETSRVLLVWTWVSTL